MWMRKLQIGLVAALALVAGQARGAEQFVSTGRPSGTLEMRPEATVVGPEVRLRQVCKWQETDEQLFAGVSDLVVTRITDGNATIDLRQLKGMLRDAGMGMASVRFAGPMVCIVTRADGVRIEDAKPTAPRLVPTSAPATKPVETGAVVSLKERLTRDLADRLQLPIETLQISFNAVDEKFLNLCEPQFQFQIEPRRVRNLGSVAWEVSAGTEAGGKPQKAIITATARAWQDQLLANRPISGRQIIRADDVIEKRSLVEELPDGTLLARAQAVGQQASMELRPGMVMTSHSVQAVPLARVGQLITVTVQSGSVQIRTVAKAVEEGSYGQMIRVTNEATKETFQVTLTGQQAGVMMTGGSNG